MISPMEAVRERWTQTRCRLARERVCSRPGSYMRGESSLHAKDAWVARGSERCHAKVAAFARIEHADAIAAQSLLWHALGLRLSAGGPHAISRSCLGLRWHVGARRQGRSRDPVRRQALARIGTTFRPGHRPRA